MKHWNFVIWSKIQQKQFFNKKFYVSHDLIFKLFTNAFDHKNDFFLRFLASPTLSAAFFSAANNCWIPAEGLVILRDTKEKNNQNNFFRLLIERAEEWTDGNICNHMTEWKDAATFRMFEKGVVSVRMFSLQTICCEVCWSLSKIMTFLSNFERVLNEVWVKL